jgi:hypothetical protein
MFGCSILFSLTQFALFLAKAVRGRDKEVITRLSSGDVTDKGLYL